MALISDIITYVDGVKPSPYTSAQKIAWLNKVDEEVKLKVMKTFLYSDILRIADTYEYSLPVGVTFDDVEIVYLDKSPIQKIDFRSFEHTGYYKSNSKLGIYPVPSSSDDASTPGIRVVYLQKFTPYTLISETLLITNQHRDVYENYIFAQINRFNRDWGDYNNEMAQYNAAWKEFENWYTARQPINKSATIKNLW